jgi:PBP1b-binding outer membrane lipoprotein LpoB
LRPEAAPVVIHSLSTVSKHQSNRPSNGPIPAVLLAGILLVTGCASQKTPALTRIPVAAAPAAPAPAAEQTQPALEPAPAHKKPSPPPATQAPSPTRPRVRETPAATVIRLLPKQLAVTDVTATTLVVRSAAASPSASLFEEAIAQSKLRGLLSSRRGIPSQTAQHASLRNGTATITFSDSVSPADAASAIAAALSVDGIQKVHAELPRP